MRWILIAGGGTGGHVFPGLAVAHELTQLADVEVIFVGSPRGLEARVVPEHGYPLELLDVEPMKGGGAPRAIRGALVAAKAMQKARTLVRRLRPAAVLSVGGYAAGPAALACVSQRVPLAILEPNSVLGLTNRLLAPFAKRAFTAWTETGRHFRGDKARLYGTPLRPGFEPRPYAPSARGTTARGELEGRSPSNANAGSKRLLVLGGSQGAQALNETLPRAIAKAIESAAVGGRHVTVLHQSGRDREASVREAYAHAGISSSQASIEVVPFIDDVAQQMAATDLIVARSGAATVAEISAIGRAAIFIPFPHAADDHQAKNAMALAELGGAVCIRQEAADEARLASEIGALLGDDARRVRMADAARAHGRPHAANDIATDLLALAGIPIGTVGGKKRGSKENGATNGSSKFRVTDPATRGGPS
jgi:UDP-N-acetylglucosamine--N-acetylmuramyl-(pentapeptide) pyrophosphoryl-undecaprenol N-acetylglucosamine transferase